MEKREIELKLVEKFSSRNLDPDKMFRVSNRDVRYFFLLSHKIIPNFADRVHKYSTVSRIYMEIYFNMQNYGEFRIRMQPQIANFRKISKRGLRK